MTKNNKYFEDNANGHNKKLKNYFKNKYNEEQYIYLKPAYYNKDKRNKKKNHKKADK